VAYFSTRISNPNLLILNTELQDPTSVAPAKVNSSTLLTSRLKALSPQHLDPKLMIQR